MEPTTTPPPTTITEHEAGQLYAALGVKGMMLLTQELRDKIRKARPDSEDPDEPVLAADEPPDAA